jgi:hypothetical protein
MAELSPLFRALQELRQLSQRGAKAISNGSGEDLIVMAFGPKLHSKTSPRPFFASTASWEESIRKEAQGLIEGLRVECECQAVKIAPVARLHDRVHDFFFTSEVTVNRPRTETRSAHNILQCSLVETAFRKAN